MVEILPALINPKASHHRQLVNPTLGCFNVLVGICLQEFRKSIKSLWKDDGWDSNRLHFKRVKKKKKCIAMGYYLGPLEVTLQQHTANFSNDAHLQYYVGGGGVEVQ